jgi:protein-arginine deiminase
MCSRAVAPGNPLSPSLRLPRALLPSLLLPSLLLWLAALAGCEVPPDGSGDGDGDTLPLRANIDADTNRDGVIDARDDAGEDTFGPLRGAVLIANVDDDDDDGVRDSRDARLSGAADLEDLTPVLVRRIVGLEGHAVRLALEPEAARAFIRIWRKDGEELRVLLDPDAASGPEAASGRAELSGADEEIPLFVEALVPRTRDWDGALTLRLTIEEGGRVLSEDVLAMRAAPIVFPDNLQRPRRIFVMDIAAGGDNNQAFVGAMRSALPAGTELSPLRGRDYGYDRWVQDNMELGYQQRPGPAGPVEMRVALQLERTGSWGGGLEAFVPYEYLAAGQGFLYPGGPESSHNYGGNLEVAPPVEGWPLGRLLYGGGAQGTLMGRPNRDNMNAEQLAFLNAQEVQAPALQLSSEWLAVGHIDEIFQFVPDLEPDEGGRGFKIVIASPRLAREALVAVRARGGGGLVVFEGRSSSYTVDQILNAEQFGALNEAAQARIDSVAGVLRRNLGLSEDDFRPVPVLFQDVGGGLVAAFNPGVQNLVTVGDRLFVPNPEGPKEGAVDLWQEATRASLADTELDVIFVDVFESYHELLGEAHCGTNVDRAPYETPWWSL